MVARGAQFQRPMGPERLRFDAGGAGLDMSQFAHLGSDRGGAISTSLTRAVDPDPTTRTAMRRLRNIYEAAPDDVRSAGMAWYSNVHDAAQKAAKEHGRSTRQAAGVVSAVSPNMDWERNNINAFDELDELASRRGWDVIRRSAATEGGRTREAKDVLRGLSLSAADDNALLRADRIWNGGEDPDEVLVRKSAPKTNSFYHNILEPHKAEHVTVDGRHADIIADAMRPWGMGRGISSANSTRGMTRYERYSDVTSRVAKQMGVLPHELQAVAWEHGKQVERGYDPKRKQGDMRIGQSYQARLGRSGEFSLGGGGR